MLLVLSTFSNPCDHATVVWGDEAVRSFVVRVCIRPNAYLYVSYCVPAKTGASTHVPTCGVSFPDEADRGAAAMFAFCVYRVCVRMMENGPGRRQRVVVLLTWCLLVCLHECV